MILSNCCYNCGHWNIVEAGYYESDLGVCSKKLRETDDDQSCIDFERADEVKKEVRDMSRRAICRGYRELIEAYNVLQNKTCQ